MKYYVQTYTLKAKTKLGELVSSAFRNKYNHSLITDEQLKEIPAEIESFMNALIRNNPRLKMLNLTVHGMTADGRSFNFSGNDRPECVQISVHGDNKGYTDSTCMRLTAYIVISDFTAEQEGGDK